LLLEATTIRRTPSPLDHLIVACEQYLLTKEILVA